MKSPIFTLDSKINQQSIFQRIFPSVKKQLNLPQESRQEKEAFREKNRAFVQKKYRLKVRKEIKYHQNDYQQSGSLYEPPEDISDSEYFNEPQKKVKVENLVKYEKDQSIKRRNYHTKLRVRDLQAISPQQFYVGQMSKKQQKRKNLIYDVDQSKQIEL